MRFRLLSRFGILLLNLCLCPFLYSRGGLDGVLSERDSLKEAGFSEESGSRTRMPTVQQLELAFRRQWDTLVENKQELFLMVAAIADPVMRTRAELLIEYLGYDQKLRSLVERLYQQASPAAHKELANYLAARLTGCLRSPPWKGYLALIEKSLEKEAAIDLVSRVLLLAERLDSKPSSSSVRGTVLDFRDAIEKAISHRIISQTRLRELEQIWKAMNDFDERVTAFNEFSSKPLERIDSSKSWREAIASEFRDDAKLVQQFFDIRSHDESSRAAFAEMLKSVRLILVDLEKLPEILVPDRDWFVHIVLWRIREAVRLAKIFNKLKQKTDAGLDLIEAKLLGPASLKRIARACIDVCAGIYAEQKGWAEAYGFLKKATPETATDRSGEKRFADLPFWERRSLIEAEEFRARYKGRYFVYANDPDVYWYKFGDAALPEFSACNTVGAMLRDGGRWLSMPYGKSRAGAENFLEVHYDARDRFTIHFRRMGVVLPYNGYRVTFRYDPKTNSAKTEAILDENGQPVSIACLNSLFEKTR